MKVVILAGGYGTRLAEETDVRPKPMVEIGGKPILWHIMKSYSQHGFNDFVILLGYKGYFIKEYFANYFLHQSNITFDLKNNEMKVLNNSSEPWKVTLIDTGIETMTGGRLLRARSFLNNEPFMFTYGDGVSDIDITKLLKFHKDHGRSATMSAVQTEGRFGSIDVAKNDRVSHFIEKPKGDGAWINGGFFVCEQKVFDYINEGDDTIFEKKPLEDMANDGELFAYKHDGFWKCMDTLRDKMQLNELWESNNAAWKTW
jgi:glucose-1-phosphate cytidylyltransferase